MTQYLLQPRDQIFVKGYEFFSFARNMGRSIGENISKNVIYKYSQKRLYHAKKSDTDRIKTASKTEIQKTAAATGDLIGDKIADRITKVSKTSPHNSSETNEEILNKDRKFLLILD